MRTRCLNCGDTILVSEYSPQLCTDCCVCPVCEMSRGMEYDKNRSTVYCQFCRSTHDYEEYITKLREASLAKARKLLRRAEILRW